MGRFLLVALTVVFGGCGSVGFTLTEFSVTPSTRGFGPKASALWMTAFEGKEMVCPSGYIVSDVRMVYLESRPRERDGYGRPNMNTANVERADMVRQYLCQLPFDPRRFIR